jgi:tripartite-type tricarboxylate transporter receptor subunit TctC
MALVVLATSEVRSVQDLVRKLRENPGRLGYASAGVGTISHLAGELFANLAGAQAIHVPYRGGASLAEAVLKGEAAFALDPLGSSVGAIRGGAVRLLAVTTRGRDRGFPDTPTMAEAGLAGFELTNWCALVGPRGMPQEVAQALNRSVNAGISEPAARARLEAAGFDPVTDSTPSSTGDFLMAELVRFREIVARVGL